MLITFLFCAPLIGVNTVPLVLLSQLSERVELKGDPRPILTDLPNYQGTEPIADIIAFLYRPEYYNMEFDSNGKSLKGYGEIIIAKNHHGRVQDIPFSYNESMTRISDYEKDIAFEIFSKELFNAP